MTYKQFADTVAAMRAAQEAWEIAKDNSFYSEMQQKIAHRNCLRLESEVDAALVVMEQQCEHPHQKWEGRPPKKICQDCGEWVE